jgi:hypothetical protein
MAESPAGGPRAGAPIDARLPARYEAARQALAECSRIDECQEWADKAEALASYARQANDDTLRKHADRIQARAIRRQGELLKQIPASLGGRPAENSGGRPPELTRASAAAAAGISEHQRKTALRVAAVPEEQFERQIESESPPTVTQLARQGIKPRQASAVPPTPEQIEAQKALAQLIALAGFCRTHDPRDMARAIRADRTAEARRVVSQLDRWLDAFIVNLGDHNSG